MNYHSLRIEDKILFDRFLKNNRRYELSTYAFTNIFIWQGLFKIFWTIIEDNLCIFFKDILGVFLYLPPLGERQSKNLIEDCFNIMDGFNLNREVSRIENVEESRLDFYRVLGYECVYKGCDYIYSSDRLLGLRGNSLKHKRAAFNYFVKHYRFNYLPFSTRYKNDCILLYRDWMRNRKIKFQDDLYIKMLEDSFVTLKQTLDNYKKLDLSGGIVKINNLIKGYTFGFRINKDTFCILFEITDHSIKGISQFIFRRFIEELQDCQYVNVMGDSDLENLRRVKLSYRPIKLMPSYIIKRKSNV